jgi:hypothetical protein
VPTNSSGSSRTATVTVGGQTYTVTQASALRPSQVKGVKVKK